MRKTDPSVVNVSVVVPCYNCAKWLSLAVESCLENQDIGIELILVDDCSDDGTRDIAASYVRKHHEVCLIENPKRMGAAGSRNVGIRRSKAKYVVFFDSDDLLPPGGLARLVDSMHADCDAVYGDVEVVDEHGKVVGFKDQYTPYGDGVITMLRNCTPVTGSVLLKRESALLLDWDRSLTCGQEFDYFLNLAVRGVVFKHVPQTSLKYRVHNEPGRISYSTQGHLENSLAKILLKVFKEDQRSELLSIDQRCALHASMLDAGIQLLRWHRKEKHLIEDLFLAIDKEYAKRAANFKRKSYAGLSCYLPPSVVVCLWKIRDKVPLFSVH